MYCFSEGDMVKEIIRFREDKRSAPWFWYRDTLLQAQDRGYLKVIADSDVLPFWWRKFDESIEMTPRLIELIEKAKMHV